MTKRQLRSSVVGIVACIVTAACSSVQPGPPADVTGIWSGSWQSGWGNKGPVTLNLQQTGRRSPDNSNQLRSTAADPWRMTSAGTPCIEKAPERFHRYSLKWTAIK
jgi:hypothetical protein